MSKFDQFSDMPPKLTTSRGFRSARLEPILRAVRRLTDNLRSHRLNEVQGEVQE